jgi:serine/threonine protein phosphatase PrpC
MSREAALLHPDRESLTSFIGVGVLEEIDRNVEPWPIHEGDSILLASDGLFKTLRSEEMLECLAGPPQTWPDRLVARTLAQGYEYQDNVTVLSVTVQDQARTLKLPPPAVELPKTIRTQTGTVAASHSRRILTILLILALVIAAGGGRWWYKKHHPSPVSVQK